MDRTMTQPPLFSSSDPISLECVLDAMGDAVCVSDSNMVFTGANTKFAAFYGMADPADIIGKSAYDVYPGFEKSVFYQACVDTIRTGEMVSRIGYSANLKGWVVARATKIGEDRYAMVVHTMQGAAGGSGAAAMVDNLTALPNRIAFEHDIGAMAGSGGGTAVAVVDISHFQQINESLGVSNGDRCLMEIASRINMIASATQRTYRIGGDQFVILDSNGLASIEQTLDNLHHVLDEPFSFTGKDVVVEFRAGMALADGPSDDPVGLLGAAEIALARAKARKVRRHLYTQADQPLYDPQQARRIKSGLENGEFDVFIQPVVDMIDNTIVGGEALVRWLHPDDGVLAPGQFLPIIEDAGLGEMLDTVVVRRAVHVLEQWHRAGLPLRLSVNLSSSSIINPATPGMIRDAIGKSQHITRQMQIEITENALINDVQASQDVIARLKSNGHLICLDDFGTGYCSMSYLLRYPCDVIKIDRSFITDLDTNPVQQVAVRNIVALAHGLGMAAVAEGVERPEEMALIRQMGCDFSQGYCHAMPMPLDQFMEWIKSRDVSSTSSLIR